MGSCQEVKCPLDFETGRNCSGLLKCYMSFNWDSSSYKQANDEWEDGFIFQAIEIEETEKGNTNESITLTTLKEHTKNYEGCHALPFLVNFPKCSMVNHTLNK